MTTSKKLPKLEFSIEQMPGCCGIGVVAHFKEEEGGYDWRTEKVKRVKRIFETKEEQAEDCYKRILEDTWNESIYGEHYAQLLISLVSNYQGKPAGKDIQFPELQDVLIREGWTIHSVFINPNHGNEVTLFGKYFPERDELPKEDDDDF